MTAAELDLDPPEPDVDDHCAACDGACTGGEEHDQQFAEIVAAVRLGLL